MGYESKFYVVEKERRTGNDGDKVWGEVIAMFDMCKLGYDLYEIIHQYPPTDTYIYADDGNTKILEDRYGEPLIEIPIEDMIRIINRICKNYPYRRFSPFLKMLKGFNPNEWDELVVLHYGY